MKSRLPLFVTLLSIILFLPQHSYAADGEARYSDTLTLYLENDCIDDTDRYYTQGMKISWVSRDISSYPERMTAPSLIHRFIDKIPLINNPDRQQSFSISFGQNIYTPEDKKRRDLIRDDRPYAGIMYLALGLHTRNRQHMDTLELDFGIVGRHSYAEDCQTEVHKWTGAEVANGWENQLHDEPVINLYYGHKFKSLQARTSQGFGLDFIPHLGVAIGNAFTGANAGGQVRIGWNIPNDFGTFLIRPGSESSSPLDNTDPRFFSPLQRFGFHLFFAVDGQAVARNILLDGNTFRDSPSVDKRPFVAEFVAGIGLIIQRVKVTCSYVVQTKEFEAQKDDQHFAALSASFTF